MNFYLFCSLKYGNKHILTEKKLTSALHYINGECEVLRPHSKRTEAHRKNVDFAVNRGKFLSKETFAELFKAVESALEVFYLQHEVKHIEYSIVY